MTCLALGLATGRRRGALFQDCTMDMDALTVAPT